MPSWAAGKTADEILDLTNQLYTALQRGEVASPAAHAPPSTPAYTPPSPVNPSDGIPQVDPTLIYTDPAAYHRQMEARTEAIIAARISGAEANVSGPLASMAKNQAMQNPKRKLVWEKYGPEIEAIIARVPPQARGRPDLWEEAADMVAGRHVDELAQARADEIMRRGSDAGQLSTQPGGNTPPTPGANRSPIDKLFDERHLAVKGFVDDNVSPAQVKAYAVARGYDEETYAKMLTDRTARKAGAR